MFLLEVTPASGMAAGMVRLGQAADLRDLVLLSAAQIAVRSRNADLA
jgi:hypothetical protein